MASDSDEVSLSSNKTMNVPLNEFNAEQRLWYAYLVASATKADGAVDPAEIEFLINALHFLEVGQKKEIQVYLKQPELLPGLSTVPAGLTTKHLASIFSDLIWVIVSDGKLTKTEKGFLKTVSDWFGFPLSLMNQLLQWGEQMLKAEKFKREILDSL